MPDTNPWPLNPAHRKVIFVLSKDDIISLEHNEAGNKLLMNEEVYIMPSHSSDPSTAAKNIIAQGLVTAGTVLIQDPFDKNRYHRESESINKIAQRKWLHFSTLCGHLGARRIEIKSIRVQDKNGDFEFKLEGGVPFLVEAHANIQKESTYTFIESMFLDVGFEGGNPDIDAANKFFKNKGLTQENFIETLLNQSQLSNNKQKEFTFKLDLTNEVHQKFKILAGIGINKIKSLKIPISLEGRYTKNTYNKTKYTLSISVKF